jgi:hypothetical protein
MSRTSTTIIRRATTKPYILGIPTYPHLLPSLRCPSARRGPLLTLRLSGGICYNHYKRAAAWNGHFSPSPDLVYGSPFPGRGGPCLWQ